MEYALSLIVLGNKHRVETHNVLSSEILLIAVLASDSIPYCAIKCFTEGTQNTDLIHKSPGQSILNLYLSEEMLAIGAIELVAPCYAVPNFVARCSVSEDYMTRTPSVKLDEKVVPRGHLLSTKFRHILVSMHRPLYTIQQLICLQTTTPEVNVQLGKVRPFVDALCLRISE